MKFKERAEFQINLYIMVFTVSAHIGWLYETILTSVRWGYFAERGFLQLPLCPIYGFGAVILLLLFGRLKNSMVIFLVSTIVTTVIELAASYLLEFFCISSCGHTDTGRFIFRVAFPFGAVYCSVCWQCF